MHIGDLKRAVEDVVLRPDDNRLSDMEERSTIAALDLCQVNYYYLNYIFLSLFIVVTIKWMKLICYAKVYYLN